MLGVGHQREPLVAVGSAWPCGPGAMFVAPEPTRASVVIVMAVIPTTACRRRTAPSTAISLAPGGMTWNSDVRVGANVPDGAEPIERRRARAAPAAQDPDRRNIAGTDFNLG